MKVKNYLDSTYLKTPEQAGISDAETWEIVEKLIVEAIDNEIFAVMIRPEYVAKARKFIDDKNSKVALGTVISFHEGTNSISDKLSEAKKAIKDGADELDFVIDYKKFISGDIEHTSKEVRECSEVVLSEGKLIKWIIETASMNDNQIAEITALIKNITEENFKGKEEKVFVKSSTGFYVTQDGKPNGATVENIKIMLSNAGKLPVKAAGGVRNITDAKKMIEMGVKRIGTSSAKAIISGGNSKDSY